MYFLPASATRSSARLPQYWQSRVWSYRQKCKWSRAAAVGPQISAFPLLQAVNNVYPSRAIGGAKRLTNHIAISLNQAIDSPVDTLVAPEIRRLAQLNQQCRPKVQQIPFARTPPRLLIFPPLQTPRKRRPGRRR